MTFLFTDIEGSTRHLERLDDRYPAVLARQRHLIVDACERNGGVAVNTEGDGVFVAFASAGAATTAALQTQHALTIERWPHDEPVRVRMGLHSGEAHVVDDDYVGMSVHIAARIAAAGHGGQILVSEVTHSLAGRPAARDLGVHRLKDVGEHHLLQLTDDRDVEFPPLRTLTALPNNLPAAVDSFVGRHVELTEVIAAVGDNRLVTLTGAGGSGKTRLALEAASALLPSFRDGVWLVSLAAVAHGTGVTPAVAAALRVSERPGESAIEALTQWLHDRAVLLVLDNCEHVVEAVTSLCDALLPAAPHLSILATSREYLGVRGEHAMRTPPLSIPDDPALASMSDAVELFLTRAQASAPDFDAGSADLGTVVHVCRRLDGLPLAIELAASRLRALSLEQLVVRLDDRFRLLTGGSRSDLPRQRTLEAVVAWSYDLLSDDEREVFARLAVFPTHFSLEMAEAVVSGPPVDTTDVFELVTRLVEKSLVTTTSVDGGLRYQLLETLRQYALDRLIERDEVDRWRASLLGWAMRGVEHVEVTLRTPAMDRALRDATRDSVSHRSAMTWAAEHGREIEALRIAAAVPVGSAADRLPLLQELFERASEADDEARAFALAAVGNLAFERGEWQTSLDANARAADLFGRTGATRQAAWSMYMQMHAAWGARDLPLVDALVADAVEEFRSTDDAMGLGYALWVASLRATDLEIAASLAAEADALLRSEDVPMGIGHNVEGRGIIALDRGEIGAAAVFISEAVEIFSTYDNGGCVAHALEAAAVVLARGGADATAAELLGAAEELRRRSGQGHRPWEVRARHGEIEEQLKLADSMRDAALEAGRRHTLASASALAISSLARAVAGQDDAISVS